MSKTLELTDDEIEQLNRAIQLGLKMAYANKSNHYDSDILTKMFWKLNKLKNHPIKAFCGE